MKRERRAPVLLSTLAFLRHLGTALRVVWPVFSGIVAMVLLLGVVVALLEGWPWADGLYFALITALTIGYGDLVPTLAITRFIAVLLGILGFLSTSILAALAVHALRATLRLPGAPPGREDW